MLYDNPKRRRLLMPLVILLVGGAIALWGTMRESKQSEEVRQMVLALCHDIRAGHDVSDRVRTMTGGRNPLLMGALTNASSAASSVEDIVVEVKPGDVESGGAYSGFATHTAIIVVNGTPTVGLRVKHNGDGAPMEILGNFVPASN